MLYLAAVGVFSTAWFNRTLLKEARSALTQITGTRVEIGQLVVDPWTLQITCRALLLRGDEAGSELPLFAAREVVIRPSLSALVRRRLRLRRLDLEGAEIHLYTRSDGSTNLPGPRAAGLGPADLDRLLDLAVRRLVIAHSDVYWDDRRIPINATATNLAVLLGFSPGHYAGSVSALELNLSRSGLRLPPLTLSARVDFSRNTVALTSMTWRSPAANGEGALTVHWLPAVECQFSFRAAGEAGRLTTLLGWKGFEQGRFEISSKGDYRPGVTTADGHLQVRQVLVTTLPLRPVPLDFAGDYSLTGARLRLTGITAGALGATVHGQAEVSVETPARRFAADLEVGQLDVASAFRVVRNGPAFLATFPVASRASGDIQLSGNADAHNIQARFDLNLEAAAAQTGHEPISGSLSGVAAFDRTISVDLEEALLRSPHSSLAVRGTIGQGSSNLTLKLQTTDFSEWRRATESFVGAPAPLELQSAGFFSGSISGSPAEPTIRGNVRVGAFNYGGWHWTGLEAGVVASRQQLQLSSGRLLGAHSTLGLDLTAGLEDGQLTADSPLKLSASAEKTSIEGLREALGIRYPAAGLLTGSLTIQGKRSELGGSGAFRVEAGSYMGEPFDSLAARFSVRGGAWTVTDVQLVKGPGRLAGKGSYDPGARAFSGSMQGRSFSLSSLHGLKRFYPAGTSGLPFESLAGQLNFDFQGQGSIDSPSLRGTVTMMQLSTNTLPLGELTTHLELNKGHGTFQGQLQGSSGTIDFHGEATTGGEWPLKLSAQYSTLRLDPWLRSFGLSAIKTVVETSGWLDLGAVLRGREPLQLSTQVEKLEVSFPELRWQNDKPFTVGLANRRLVISPFQLVGPSTQFRFQGSVVLSAPSAVDLSAQGEINASLLRVLDPALLTTGHFDAELQVRGTVAQPSLYGSLHVHGVGLAYPGLPVRLAGLNGDIQLEGSSLVIQSLTAASGPSSIGISGLMTLSGTPRYNVRAELTRVRVEYPPQFTSVLSGSVRLAGTPHAGLVSGDLTVAQMFISENFNILNWISQLEAQNAMAVPSGQHSLASSARLNIHVSTAPVVTIQSRDLNLVAAINLELRGTLGDPVAFGNAHIESGQAVIRQTRYTISRGDITMANPSQTQPTLDLEATTRVQRYDITLKVTGPADRPNVLYRSEPPLTAPEILGLLAFGYTSENQLIGTSGSSTIGTEGASALLSQALSTQVSSRITRLFGLSRVSIDPNPSSLGGARLTVEERLARDFTITYVTTTGTVQERIIQVEWDLTDSVSLLGIRDQNGVYGFELDFRKRFK